jgi:branched-chain amino acid transport system permease protein
MNELVLRVNRLTRGHASIILAGILLVLAILLPLLPGIDESGKFIGVTTRGLALVVMALGLNIVVGFAGLLDLGYVAFYAFGSYCVGWFASDFFGKAHVHVGAVGTVATQPGVHLNFLLVCLAAILICATVGILIGLPTLRLRGD